MDGSCTTCSGSTCVQFEQHRKTAAGHLEQSTCQQALVSYGRATLWRYGCESLGPWMARQGAGTVLGLRLQDMITRNLRPKALHSCNESVRAFKTSSSCRVTLCWAFSMNCGPDSAYSKARRMAWISSEVSIVSNKMCTVILRTRL